MTDLKSRLERALAFDEYELTGRETELERLNIGRYQARTALIDQRLIAVAVAADVFIHGGLEDELGVKLEDALDALREALPKEGT